MATYKQVLDSLGGIEELLQKLAGRRENRDLRRELDEKIGVVRSLQELVETRFGETTKGSGGEPEEVRLAMEEIARKPRRGMELSSRPAFILGYRRSGTTLLAWLLDSHPKLAAVPENALCRSLLGEEELRLPEVYERRLDLIYAYKSLDEMGETRARFLSRVAALIDGVFTDYARRCGKPRWVDKEVFLANSVDLLDAIFGYQAQYVYLVRHGLDTAYSASERFGERLGTPIVREGSLNLRNYLRYWVDANEALIDFHERNRDRCLLVRYEDLVASPEPTARRIIEFLGERWHPRIFEDMQRQEHHDRLGDNKIHATGGKIDPTRRERWRRWPPELVRQLGRLADPTLIRLGFEPLNPS
jgi:hypothetical protein